MHKVSNIHVNANTYCLPSVSDHAYRIVHGLVSISLPSYFEQPCRIT